MPITLEQAKALQHGDILHSNHYRNADGTCQRWRVNGKVKTWKRSPEKICVPLARGLYQHDYLTHRWLYCFHLSKECPHNIQYKVVNPLYHAEKEGG